MRPSEQIGACSPGDGEIKQPGEKSKSRVEQWEQKIPPAQPLGRGRIGKFFGEGEGVGLVANDADIFAVGGVEERPAATGGDLVLGCVLVAVAAVVVKIAGD